MTSYNQLDLRILRDFKHHVKLLWICLSCAPTFCGNHSGYSKLRHKPSPCSPSWETPVPFEENRKMKNHAVQVFRMVRPLNNDACLIVHAVKEYKEPWEIYLLGKHGIKPPYTRFCPLYPMFHTEVISQGGNCPKVHVMSCNTRSRGCGSMLVVSVHELSPRANNYIISLWLWIRPGTPHHSLEIKVPLTFWSPSCRN